MHFHFRSLLAFVEPFGYWSVMKRNATHTQSSTLDNSICLSLHKNNNNNNNSNGRDRRFYCVIYGYCVASCVYETSSTLSVSFHFNASTNVSMHPFLFFFFGFVRSLLRVQPEAEQKPVFSVIVKLKLIDGRRQQ